MIQTPMQHEAKQCARDYQGSFGFMVQMRRRAQDPSWVPTPAQAAAILKARAYSGPNAPRRARRRRSTQPR